MAGQAAPTATGPTNAPGGRQSRRRDIRRAGGPDAMDRIALLRSAKWSTEMQLPLPVAETDVVEAPWRYSSDTGGWLRLALVSGGILRTAVCLTGLRASRSGVQLDHPGQKIEQ